MLVSYIYIRNELIKGHHLIKKMKIKDQHFSVHVMLLISCKGEGNGNPLQYFCLEDPVDGGAW